MKFTFTTALCSIITIVVVATVALASCDDNTSTPVQAIQEPRIAPSEIRPTFTSTPAPLPSMDRFETGMVTPAWSHNAYSNYGATLHDMKVATDARWVELPILFKQVARTSTRIAVSPDQVSPASLAKGIQSAHAEGLRVFIEPILGVDVSGDWSGVVEPSNEQTWFDNYWLALQPYAQASQAAGADQLSIGVELAWLQDNAPASLWQALITHVTNIYHGQLTYDTDWSNLINSTTPPMWMLDSRLHYIGVDEYISLADTSEYVDPSLIPQLWEQRVQSILDTFSVDLGKPIIISEIGFRDRADALYREWSITSSASKSPTEQSGAFNGVLTDLQHDNHIVGFFPYSWLGSGDMNLKGSPALSIIKKYYQEM